MSNVPRQWSEQVKLEDTENTMEAVPAGEGGRPRRGLSLRSRYERASWQMWMMLEKTLQSPLDYKEIKPVNPKGNQS